MNALQTAARKGWSIFRVNPDKPKTAREGFLLAIIDEHAPTVLSDAELMTEADRLVNELRERYPLCAEALHKLLWQDREAIH